MLDTIFQDIRYAARGLRAKPAFTIAVVLTLGLGLGANAAMFGIIDRMLFRPPPLMIDPATAHRVYVTRTFRGKEETGNVSQYARFVDLTKWTTSFSSTAGFTVNDLAVGVGDAAREMRIASVSASYFGFFDAKPQLGRYFTAAEDAPPSGEPVAVLSDAVWQTNYGGRADAVGTKVQIGPLVYTIIGVAPPGFAGLTPDRPPAFFIPLASRGGSQGFSKANTSWWKTYTWGWLSMIARRKPGVSIEAANADLTNAMRLSYEANLVESPRATPFNIAKPRATIGSILTERGPNTSPFAKVATWVGGVALIVLLVACANVANLLLARALQRRREIAVRLALGVSRGRLLSQLFTESFLLALLGGGAAIVIAQFGGAALRAGLMPQSEATASFRDPRTILFTTLAAVVVGLLTGLAPVLQAGRANLAGDLKAGGREGSFSRSRARVVLLVLQGAMSVILLVGAGLFVRSLTKVQSMRLGFDIEPVAIVSLNMRGVEVDSVAMAALRARLRERAANLPGVVGASLQTSMPFWSTWSVGLYVEGIDTVSKLGQFNLNGVSQEHFAVFGTRIIRGRGFTDADGPSAPRAIVVSENMAKTIWPDKDALGQCIRVESEKNPCSYVVGIAENIKAQSLTEDTGLYYYLPTQQFRPQTGGLFVRTRGKSADAIEAIRRELQHEMPGASYVTLTPLTTILGSRMSSWKLGATMFVAFGILALTLAAIGMYSVIAYNVTQRNHEMGVRAALGAQGRDLTRLVVGEGVKLGAVGVAIGAAIALAAGKWVKPLLFQQSPTDPTIFAIVTFGLLLVAVAASWMPARRASRVDPSVALRSD
ncbi:MAG TPA: ABC transporter permease [Gemmatimonadaceae bacterium]